MPQAPASDDAAAGGATTAADDDRGRGVDFATGKPVDLFKPEEEVRQEYERILHNDLGYPKSLMDIEVPVQMGAAVKRADLVVYDRERRNIVGVVETKAPGVKKGRAQLRSYMSALSTCVWGVWTNGSDCEYAFKRANTGEIVSGSAFAIPRCGEESAAIRGAADLRPARNLKAAFREINNLIYANANLAQSAKQGAEMVRLIFCKLCDEAENKVPEFQVRPGEPPAATRKRLDNLWRRARDGWLGGDIFDPAEKLLLDDKSLAMVVGRLQGFALWRTDRDVIGDAFEVFSERQFAGEKGQFFTPRAVVRMAVDMADPRPGEKIIDPACGSGGFLIHALARVWGRLEKSGQSASERRKRGLAGSCFFGADKEIDLVRICKAHMCLMGDGKSNIAQADSLKGGDDWSPAAQSILLDEAGGCKRFDVVLTNPPFGARIRVADPRVLRQYELGRKWKKTGARWEKTDEPRETAPQVLFVEKCLNLLKDGGRMAIVLPDGLLGNQGDGHVRQFIRERADILAVVDCPPETFMPHTGTKTSVLLLRKRPAAAAPAADGVFMAVAEKCGHTARGRPLYRDAERLTVDEDFSAIAQSYRDGAAGGGQCFRVARLTDGILAPRYYDPRIAARIAVLRREQGAEFKTLGELEAEKQLTIGGVGRGPAAEEMSATGAHRYIRTADLGAFELRTDAKRKVDATVFERYRAGQDLRVNDILFVKDGDQRIGDCVMLFEDDLNILVQGHFNRLRALKGGIDPFLLFYLLNTDIVKRQVRQRVFSQATLSTIGGRIRELALPVPECEKRRREIAAKVRALLAARRKALAELRGL